MEAITSVALNVVAEWAPATTATVACRCVLTAWLCGAFSSFRLGGCCSLPALLSSTRVHTNPTRVTAWENPQRTARDPDHSPDRHPNPLAWLFSVEAQSHFPLILPDPSACVWLLEKCGVLSVFLRGTHQPPTQPQPSPLLVTRAGGHVVTFVGRQRGPLLYTWRELCASVFRDG